MPKLDSKVEEIYVRSFTDQWGPFAFDFSKAKPPGTSVSISSVVVKSSLNGIDTTANLIETGTTSIDSDIVRFKLQYPSASYHGLHLLTFETTYSTGAKQAYTFGYVVVEA